MSGLFSLLRKNDFDRLEEMFRSFFDSIPYEWYTNNPMANYQCLYATVIYTYFAA